MQKIDSKPMIRRFFSSVCACAAVLLILGCGESKPGNPIPPGDANDISPNDLPPGDTGPVIDCVGLEAGVICDDGDPCTSGDTCDGQGSCIAASTTVCLDLDKNPCTNPVCDADNGDPDNGHCMEVPLVSETVEDVCYQYECVDGEVTANTPSVQNECADWEVPAGGCIDHYVCDSEYVNETDGSHCRFVAKPDGSACLSQGVGVKAAADAATAEEASRCGLYVCHAEATEEAQLSVPPVCVLSSSLPDDLQTSLKAAGNTLYHECLLEDVPETVSAQCNQWRCGCKGEGCAEPECQVKPNTPMVSKPCDNGDLCDGSVCKPAKGAGAVMECQSADVGTIVCDLFPEATCDVSGPCDAQTGCPTTMDLEASNANCLINNACIDAFNTKCAPNDPNADPATGCVVEFLKKDAPCADALKDGCVLEASCQPVGESMKCEVNEWVNCDDLNECTKDFCADDICQYSPLPGPCDDDNVCTTKDLCAESQCTGTALDCDDTFACTADSCNPQSGCKHQADDTLCDDSNICTDNGCSPDNGCVFTDNTASCDDNNVCTTEDTCANGACQSGAALSCDNGLFCDGAETCDAATGCQAGTAPATADGVGCTIDSCDEGSDTVLHTPDDNACADGLFCNGMETCDAATGCKAGTAPATADAVACTVDSCDEATDTVLHTAMDSACADTNPCTDDLCDAVGGCQNPALPDETECSDDGTKWCQSGECVPKSQGIDCSDIHRKNPAWPDGVYVIDPDEAGGNAPFQVYCDMTTDGGGWTLTAVSSDDGQSTWTWNNRHYWDTDTTTFGFLNALDKDFKSRAHHEVLLDDALFVHAPSSVWASYHAVGDGGAGLAQKIEEIGGPNCYAHGDGYALTAGTVALEGVLCSTELFLNAQDHDGSIGCSTSTPNDGYGPGWSGGNWKENKCPFNDNNGLGPSKGWGSTKAKTESSEYLNGFAGMLDLNTGAAGSGENNMRVYVRQAICGNGVKEGDEQCDDNNTADGDGCSANCQIQSQGIDCADIHWKNPAWPDGVYVIDPDEAGPNALFNAYCDMTTEDGGWTLLTNLSDNSYPFVPESEDFATPSLDHNYTWNLEDGTLEFEQRLVRYNPGLSTSVIINSNNVIKGGHGYAFEGENPTVLLTAMNKGEAAGCKQYSLAIVPTGACLQGSVWGCFDQAVAGRERETNQWCNSGWNGVMAVFARRPICGNGVTEPGEACDDGNMADGDGCSAACVDECVPGTEWTEIYYDSLASKPSGAQTHNGACCGGQGAGDLAGKSGWVQKSDWNGLWIPHPAETLDHFAVELESVTVGNGSTQVGRSIGVVSTKAAQNAPTSVSLWAGYDGTVGLDQGPGPSPLANWPGLNTIGQWSTWRVEVDRTTNTGRVLIDGMDQGTYTLDQTALTGAWLRLSSHAGTLGNSSNVGWRELHVYSGSSVECPECGNGEMEGDEACDDGNTDDGDGCSAGCQIQSQGIDCADIHQKHPSWPDGAYTIDPDATGAFVVYCDMSTKGGGWTLVLTASGDSTEWGACSSRWTSAGTDAASSQLQNVDLHSPAYHRLSAKQLMIVNESVTRHYVMEPNWNHSLRHAFKENISYTHYVKDVNQYKNSGEADADHAYVQALGYEYSGNVSKYCVWLGINDSKTGGSRIGLAGDNNWACTWYPPDSGTHDDFSLGVGVQDTEMSCPMVAGYTQGLKSITVDGSAGGNSGTWHVFVRRPFCGNGQKEGDEACDDGNTDGGDGCSATCTAESCAFSFDAADATMSLATSDFDIGGADFTFEFWIRADKQGTAGHVFRTKENWNQAMAVSVNNTTADGAGVSAFLSQADNFCQEPNDGIAQVVPRDDAWHHIAVVRQDTDLIFYLDGGSPVSQNMQWGGCSCGPNNTPCIGGGGTGYFGAAGNNGNAPSGISIGPTRFVTGAQYTAAFQPSKSWPVANSTIAQWNTAGCLTGGNLPDETGGNDGTNAVGMTPVAGP